MKSSKKYLPAELIINSFLLAASIFVAAILLNYGLDFVRWSKIERTISEHEISAQAAALEWDMIKGNCGALKRKFFSLKEQIREIGKALASYSSLSLFRKIDFDYLKRKYILSQLNLYILLKRLNSNCGTQIIPIVFFFEIDQKPSERQGLLIEELVRQYENQTAVFSLDLGYQDEPLVGVFAAHFGIDSAPSVVLGSYAFHGFHWLGELNASLQAQLWSPNWTWTFEATGVPKEKLLAALADSEDPDAKLVLARLQGRTGCFLPNWSGLLAGAVECGNLEKLKEASGWKAELLGRIAARQRPEIEFQPAQIEPALEARNWSSIIIGSSSIELKPGDTVLFQVDRVTRDWLSGQLQSPFSKNYLTVFSEKFFYNESELRPDIGWHEGAIAKALAEIGINISLATLTIAARKGSSWYAPDEKGIFRFELGLDKLLYPTTRLLTPEIALIVDTHGVSALVDQAMQLRPKAVIADCDTQGKVAAAKWLSDAGIAVICSVDLNAWRLLGHRATVLAAPPFKIEGKKAVFGGTQIEIKKGEHVVAMNASHQRGLIYYAAPAYYFSVLARVLGLNVSYVTVTDYGQVSKVTRAAEAGGAKVIAVRIFNSADFQALKEWLSKDGSRRAILFHSLAYPYGKIAFSSFPGQVAFGDISLVIK